MRRLLSVLLMLIALPAAAAAAEGKRVAFVAGNSAYRFVPALPNPTNDATAVANALARVGFNVTLATDRSGASLRGDIDNFIKEVEQAGPGSTVVVYYAGHGFQLDGTNYLLPIDAKSGKDLDLGRDAVALPEILKRLDATGAATKIVILDACRDNPLAEASPGLAMLDIAAKGESKGEAGLARVESNGGTLVAFSTSPGATASDGAGNHSPYTGAFLKLMNEPGVPAEQLFKRVRVAVNQLTNGAQTPWETSSLTANFMFVPAKLDRNAGEPAIERAAYVGGERPTKASLAGLAFEDAYRVAVIWDSVDVYRVFLDVHGADPRSIIIYRALNLRQAETAWLMAVREGTREAYELFLALYPGAHVGEARRLSLVAPRRGELTTASLCTPENNVPKLRLPLGNPQKRRTEAPPQIDERPTKTVVIDRPIREEVVTVEEPRRPIIVIDPRPKRPPIVDDKPKRPPVVVDDKPKKPDVVIDPGRGDGRPSGTGPGSTGPGRGKGGKGTLDPVFNGPKRLVNPAIKVQRFDTPLLRTQRNVDPTVRHSPRALRIGGGGGSLSSRPVGVRSFGGGGLGGGRSFGDTGRSFGGGGRSFGGGGRSFLR